jgi:recombination protein U
MIETSNFRYKLEGKALIQKIPTPVKVLNIDSRTGKINNAFYEKKSTVDYTGVYRGKFIAFDAKQTSVDTRFDLSNVKAHQYSYLEGVHKQKGISFLIIRFSNLDENYYLPFEILDEYWRAMEQGGRKSIPYGVVAKEEYRIKGRGLVLLDYLRVLEEVELNINEHYEEVASL